MQKLRIYDKATASGPTRFTWGNPFISGIWNGISTPGGSHDHVSEISHGNRVCLCLNDAQTNVICWI